MRDVGRKTRWAMAVIGGMVVLGLLLVIRGDDGDCGGSKLTVAGDGVQLIESAGALEAVVTADEAFRVGALNWILRIGRLEFDRSHHPDGDLNRIAFPLPAEAVALLEDGDGIDVRYGNPITSGASGYARADLDVDRTAGFATIRVVDAC